MIRRALVLASAATLLALAAPSWAGPAKCATFSDVKGDGGPADQKMPDPALDITAVKFASNEKALTMTVTLDKLSQRPMFAPGNRVQTTFTVKGRVVVVYYKYATTREQESNVFFQQGIRVDNVFFSANLEPKVDGNTVVMKVKYPELKAAVGSEVKGQKLTDLKAEAMASYVATNQVWDTATAAPAVAAVAGAVCV